MHNKHGNFFFLLCWTPFIWMVCGMHCDPLAYEIIQLSGCFVIVELLVLSTNRVFAVFCGLHMEALDGAHFNFLTSCAVCLGRCPKSTTALRHWAWSWYHNSHTRAEWFPGSEEGEPKAGVLLGTRWSRSHAGYGIELHIRKIVNEIPNQRQTLMYTATWGSVFEVR